MSKEASSKPASTHPFFATMARGLEPLFCAEAQAWGAEAIAPGRGGVAFLGGLEVGYRACLWSRTASRILCVIDRFELDSGDDLYRGVRRTPWDEHLSPDQTLAIDCVAIRSPITNSQFGAQRAKDAIVDQLREASGRRPSVDIRNPDLRLNLFLEGSHAQLAVDLAGQSLHRRGYRKSQGKAPLKENVAAAMLLLAGWPALAEARAPMLDPMCGSGTLLIEAALLACDTAPGLLRETFGFEGWRQHRPELWLALRQEALQRDRRGDSAPASPIVGYDADHRAVASTRANARAAGVETRIRVEQRELRFCEPPAGAGPGILVVNPPYGERLGEVAALKPLYVEIGDLLKRHFGGWTAHVLSSKAELARAISLKSARRPQLYNGPIACRLLCYPITASTKLEGEPDEERARSGRVRRLARSKDSEAFANRLRKNARHFGRWARRSGIACYRLYDADLPQYAAAIDRYGDHVHLQDYAPPPEIDAQVAEDRLHDMLVLTSDVLDIPAQNVHHKTRRRQRGDAQYERLDAQGEFFAVEEGGHRFWVNLDDYLDSGLFLDHRELRARIGALARGRRMLNLFCYTGSATVYAAKGGATRTTSVDLSATYLDWAERNLRLNGLSLGNHRLERADCQTWLASERGHYGLIFIDPPTYSNSKKMRQPFEVQRDHAALIHLAMGCLEPGGVLIFSNNFRRFGLDPAIASAYKTQDISKQTLPMDFARRPRIRHVWQITAKTSGQG